MFSFATVPFVASALNVTTQFPEGFGFGVTPGSTGPTIGFGSVSNFAFTSMFLSIAVADVNSGSHPLNI
ncbi:hypothetical protein [Fenollaria sporofastidiosus]|nr:hypothetical protein [Fenollaria sporofastidiosus]